MADVGVWLMGWAVYSTNCASIPPKKIHARLHSGRLQRTLSPAPIIRSVALLPKIWALMTNPLFFDVNHVSAFNHTVKIYSVKLCFFITILVLYLHRDCDGYQPLFWFERRRTKRLIYNKKTKVRWNRELDSPRQKVNYHFLSGRFYFNN